jgi:lysophospholipid acyltransferase (LPLAT)-like uncharacterized protein
MIPTGNRLARTILPPLAGAYLGLIRRTMRLTFRNRRALDDARRESGQYILAFWHSRFLMIPYGHLDGEMTAIVTRHADGEVLVRTMSRFGYHFVRGSSSSGGSGALREFVRRLRAGSDGLLAVDGPRGPRRRAKLGAIAAARMSGLPIVPVAFSAAPARRVRSWDCSLVPRLFARGLFVFGDPMLVPRHSDRAAQERLRVDLERRLDALTDGADRETGIGPEEPPPPSEPE